VYRRTALDRSGRRDRIEFHAGIAGRGRNCGSVDQRAASAEETCHAFESRFAKERICLSSALAPQAGNTFRSSHDG
jgi:hypothetical protein